MNIRYLLSFILLFTTTFDATLFAAKRSFDEGDMSEHFSDDNFCDDDEDNKRATSSSPTKKTYPCRAKTCGKSFIQSGSRNRHERSHSEIKSYPCQHCNKTFIYPADLSSHELSHSGTKYPCDLCDKIFTTQKNCFRHIKAAHEGQTYPCQYCDKTFTYATSHTRHQKNCKQNPALPQAGPALPLQAVEPTLDHESDDLSDTASPLPFDPLLLSPAQISLLPPHQQAKLDPALLHFVTTLNSLMQAANPDPLPNLAADDTEHNS